jgi:hypothetical protein
MVKRMYFFKDGFCFEYDPRPETDRLVRKTAIGTRFKGLKPPFTDRIDAAVNWGNGFIHLFKDSHYWKYDALRNRVTTAAPRAIAEGWPELPRRFTQKIDAAFNAGNGKAYFFSGKEYLRYHIQNSAVDVPDPGTPGYPRKIADTHGWRGLPGDFARGIDAAVNAGNGKLYFFKGPQYVRVTFESRSVDADYPLDIEPLWPGLPSALDAGVEWIHAGSATIEVTVDPNCKTLRQPDGSIDLEKRFIVEARLSPGDYPALCGCAEYRQFVRGVHKVNGHRVRNPLPDPANPGNEIEMRPRPGPGDTGDNFLEDGSRGPVKHYGHRNDGVDLQGIYDQPDQRSGCQYIAVDNPGITIPPGGHGSFDLDFRGVVIDVCADDEVLAQKLWTVNC